MQGGQFYFDEGGQFYSGVNTAGQLIDIERSTLVNEVNDYYYSQSHQTTYNFHDKDINTDIGGSYSRTAIADSGLSKARTRYGHNLGDDSARILYSVQHTMAPQTGPPDFVRENAFVSSYQDGLEFTVATDAQYEIVNTFGIIDHYPWAHLFSNIIFSEKDGEILYRDTTESRVATSSNDISTANLTDGLDADFLIGSPTGLLEAGKTYNLFFAYTTSPPKDSRLRIGPTTTSGVVDLRLVAVSAPPSTIFFSIFIAATLITSTWKASTARSMTT